MSQIAKITGEDLTRVLDELQRTEGPDPWPITSLSVAVDGGAKFKINETMWSPPLGEIVGDMGPTEPKILGTDETVYRAGHLALVIDEPGCIVLVTPGQRHTITNVAELVRHLEDAQVAQAVREDQS